MYTKVGKPSVLAYTRVTFEGDRTYDDVSVTFDDTDTLFDSVNVSQYTNVAKPTSSVYTKVPKPT